LHRIILGTIIVIYVILGALYALKTPKWQAPDEPSHFNYIRTIGDTGTLPILQPGDYDQQYLEQIKAAKFPLSMPIDGIRYESYQPPLYYLSAAPVYLVARAGRLDLQVLALRLYSVVLEVLVLLLAFLIVREIFPGDHILPLATVGAMATIPMHIAITSSVSNDTAAELVIALILLLSVRRLKNIVGDRQFIILGGILFAAALLTKLTAYLTGGALLVTAELGHSAIYNPQLTTRPLRLTSYVSRFTFYVLPRLVLLFLLSLTIASPMFIRNMLTYGITDPLGSTRHDLIVLGQPTTAEMITQYGLNHILFDLFAVTFKSFWAQFGWMGVLVNDRIYVLLLALTGMAFLGAVFYALRILRRRDLLTPVQWWGLSLLTVLWVTGVVDYIGYNFKFFQLQGRYLFPAIIPITLFGVIGWREVLAKEYVQFVFVLFYVGLVGLDIVSLFLYIVPQLRA
jgi:hypothetical protein